MKAISEIQSTVYDSFTIEKKAVDNRTVEQTLAIDIAEYFNEKVGLWIGIIRRARVRPWVIRSKFEELRKQNELEVKAKVRILMAYIKKS